MTNQLSIFVLVTCHLLIITAADASCGQSSVKEADDGSSTIAINVVPPTKENVRVFLELLRFESSIQIVFANFQ